MERLTKRINDVVTYIGTENEYDTGMIAAETASSVAAVRKFYCVSRPTRTRG